MEIEHFGIVLKVNDLNICRNFYRELFAPRLPIMDSSFTVVFELTPHLTFSLERSSATFLEHSCSSQVWKLVSPNLDSVRQRLEAMGCELVLEPLHQGTTPCWRGCDPEGNVFLLSGNELN